MIGDLRARWLAPVRLSASTLRCRAGSLPHETVGPSPTTCPGVSLRLIRDRAASSNEVAHGFGAFHKFILIAGTSLVAVT